MVDEDSVSVDDLIKKIRESSVTERVLVSSKKIAQLSSPDWQRITEKLGSRDLSFRDVQFLNGFDCSGITFPGLVSFDGCQFLGDVRMSGASFQRGVTFRRGIREAVFRAGLQLDDVEVGGVGVDFSNARFEGDCSFMRIRVTGLAMFTNAVFLQNASFAESMIGKACFHNARFERAADFSRSCFSTAAAFWGDSENRVFHGTVEFRDVVVPVDCVIRFHGVRLDQASFMGTSLSQMEFEAVTWDQSPQFLYGSRITLSDEAEWQRLYLIRRVKGNKRGTDDYSHAVEQLSSLEVAYRQLTGSYERSGQYLPAGECHYAAMECCRFKTRFGLRRSAGGAPRVVLAGWIAYRMKSWFLSLPALYRLVSCYGERPGHALSMLVILYVALYLVFFVHGGDSLAALAHGLKALIPNVFVGDLSFSPKTLFHDLTGLVGTLLGTSQLALFVLAVRRRMRR